VNGRSVRLRDGCPGFRKLKSPFSADPRMIQKYTVHYIKSEEASP